MVENNNGYQGIQTYAASNANLLGDFSEAVAEAQLVRKASCGGTTAMEVYPVARELTVPSPVKFFLRHGIGRYPQKTTADMLYAAMQDTGVAYSRFHTSFESANFNRQRLGLTKRIRSEEIWRNTLGLAEEGYTIIIADDLQQRTGQQMTISLHPNVAYYNPDLLTDIDKRGLRWVMEAAGADALPEHIAEFNDEDGQVHIIWTAQFGKQMGAKGLVVGLDHELTEGANIGRVLQDSEVISQTEAVHIDHALVAKYPQAFRLLQQTRFKRPVEAVIETKQPRYQQRPRATRRAAHLKTIAALNRYKT